MSDRHAIDAIERAKRKREARLWAYGMAAALLRADVQNMLLHEESELDDEGKLKALEEVIAFLDRKSEGR